MGEEVRVSDCHEEEEDDTNNDGGEGEEDDEEEDRVIEWEIGLPSSDNLMPLSQGLIPPELASAFSILPEPLRTLVEVNRASRTTFSGLHPGSASSLGFSTNNNYKPFVEDRRDEGMDLDGDDDDRWDSRRSRKIDSPEEADSALRTDNSAADDPSTRALKRPRLVWTPQLHKRFVDVVAHLGLKNAVPKTIIQLMNVEGLTRENVASHLQKYRLYVKRMHGLSNEGPPPPSSSDQLFLSTPVPHSLREAVRGSGPHVNGRASVAIAMPYGSPPLHMMPMPVYGMGNGFGHMGMQMGIPSGFEPNQYAAQQRDWSGNKFGSAVPYPRPASNEN